MEFTKVRCFHQVIYLNLTSLRRELNRNVNVKNNLIVAIIVFADRHNHSDDDLYEGVKRLDQEGGLMALNEKSC